MSQRWVAVAAPGFPWERAALSYVRERFPDHDPFRAWSNFECVAEDGSINEVDSRVPYIEPLIFLSAPGVRCELMGAASQHTRR